MSDNEKSASPHVSVVITCYNYGRYLTGALESVFAQTFTDFEVIVVDDGSTDDTPAIMAKYAERPYLLYIRQDNGGQAKAKNTGFRNARGKYIGFLDADDLWEKDKLEKQLKLFSSDSIGVVYTRPRYIDGDGRDLDFKLTGEYLKPQRGRVTNFLFMDNFIPFSSALVRRDCLERFGAFDETLKMGIDWDLWLRISTVYQFDFVDEPLLIYRMGHADQMSKNAEERQRSSDKIMRRFEKRFPEYISHGVLRRALSYTSMNRGYYHSSRSLRTALRFYWRAFVQWPFSVKPMVGALRAIGKRALDS